MSEPLNDFLELVETCADNLFLSDKMFGSKVRDAWEELRLKEKQEG